MSAYAQWVIASGAVVTALAVLYRYIVGPSVRLFRKIEHVADTYNGEPARDGLPARPGIVDRLIYIETELRPNGGGSMKDAVNRIEAKVDQAAALAAEAKSLVAEVKDHAEEMENAATSQRDAISDRLTHWVEEGQVREAAYLASLAEIGIDIALHPKTEQP